jgi:hypothetical protein
MSKHKETMSLEAERRKRYLENLIKEAIVNVLAEQAQEAPAPPADPNAPALPPAPPATDMALPSDGTEENQAKSPAEFTVDDMIERLNTIRGGQSFTDPEIYGQLIGWFKKLNDDQKAVLQNFLIEISKIVVNIPKASDEAAANAAPPAPPTDAAAPPAAPAAPAAPATPAPPVAPGQAPAV